MSYRSFKSWIRRQAAWRGLLAALSVSMSVFTGPARAQVSVVTQHNNTSRTGANLSETRLNVANVNQSQFGKLFTRAVDSKVWTQPLYVPGLIIPNKGTHNVVFVATE